MTGERHIHTAAELEATLAELAGERRMVFFAGLPGVGKSLFSRELARVAAAQARTVHLLQWDVARLAFETPELLARFPETAGETHPVIRKAVGLWARAAVERWHAGHPGPGHLLIGETPLIGNRLLELARPHAAGADPPLVEQDALFVIPVPSREVRAAVESARARTFARPTHAREAGDAPPGIVSLAWQEAHALAVRIGATPATVAGDAVPYDPQAYAAVYRHLLRHRQGLTLWVDAVLEPGASVYDGRAGSELVASPAEAAAVVARIEAAGDLAEVERQAARWFDLV